MAVPPMWVNPSDARNVGKSNPNSNGSESDQETEYYTALEKAGIKRDVMLSICCSFILFYSFLRYSFFTTVSSDCARPNLKSINMASTKLPIRYENPEYQEAHREVFQGSLTRPVKPVLPPGVSQADFKLAVEEFVRALGSDGVIIGDAISDYVDPYELYEDNELERKVASAAVL